MDLWSQVMEACSPWTYLVLMTQVMLVTLIVERAILLFFHTSRSRAYLDVVQRLLEKGERERVEKVSHFLNDGWARVVLAGLEAWKEGPQWVRDAATRVARTQVGFFYRRLGHMAGVSLVSLALGLAGTWALLQGGRELPEPGILGQPMAWSPALAGGVTAGVGLVLAGLFTLRAWLLVQQLLKVPTLLQGWVWRAEEKAGRPAEDG